MIIIVEGIDRVGKTTLCNMIKNRISNHYIYRDSHIYYGDYLNAKVNSEKINSLVNAIERKIIQNAIFDRFHMTEYVYGIVERNYENKDMIDVDKRLSFLDNILYVYVKPSNIELSSNMHGNDLSKHDDIFNKMFMESKINKKICVDFNSLDRAVNYVELYSKIM